MSAPQATTVDGPHAVQAGGTRRRPVALALKIAFSMLLLGVIGWSVDLDATAGAVGRMHLGAIATTTVLFAASVAVIAPRWRAILLVLGHDLPTRHLMRSVYAGFLVNQALPTAVGGDVLRVHAATRYGVPVWRATSSVLVDRIMGIVGALLLLSVGMLVSGEGGRPIRTIAFVAGGIAVAAIVGLLVLRLFPPLPMAWAERASTPLRTLSGDTWSCLRDSKHGAVIVALGVVAQLIPVGALYLIMSGSGLALPAASFLVIGPLLMLVSTIPLSFAGWGIREGALVLLLSHYGVAASDALAVSIVFGGLLLLAALPGLIFWRH